MSPCLIDFYKHTSFVIQKFDDKLNSISYRWLILAYTLYLIMIITNPFFFSSNGIILLSIVLLIDEYEEL